MPEAVIVSTARSPIGRANKGSLKDFRPDDLTAHDRAGGARQGPRPRPAPPSTTCCSAAACPAASPATTWRGSSPRCSAIDDVPGATVTRYCSSSVQTTRMAFHAIKAGEGDVFISAGVETVSRFAKGTSDHIPDTRNPRLRRRRGAHRTSYAEGGQDWHDPREDGELPDIYIAMGQTAENVARMRGLDRKELDEFGVRSQNLAEKAIADGFWAREITPVTLARRHGRQQGRRPARGSDLRRHRRARPGLPSRRRRHRRQLLRAQRRRGGGRDHVRHQGRRARPHAAGPDRLHRRLRPLPRDHGPRPGRGDEAARWRTPG